MERRPRPRRRERPIGSVRFRPTCRVWSHLHI
jgi:hypothetical protein